MEAQGAQDSRQFGPSFGQNGSNRYADFAVDDLCISDDGLRGTNQQLSFEKEARSRLDEQAKQLEHLESLVKRISDEAKQQALASTEIKPAFSKSDLYFSVESAKVAVLKQRRHALLEWINQKTNQEFKSLEEAVSWRIQNMQK